MSANVALTETFDQWRVKTNELLVMTQTDGSPNFVKLTNTTDSSSNTTGSIITAGGVGIAKSMTIGENLNVHGNIHANGAISADGNLTLGDAATDTVSFSADINSNFIPDANVSFDLGSTAQHWANLYIESVRATQNTTSGIPAVFVSGNDADVKSVDIVAGQTTANAVNIVADSLTTASVLTVSENSSDTSARKVLSVVQDSGDAYQSVALDIQSDGGRKGIHLDKNYTNILAATGANKVFGVQVDLDQTAASGTATIDVTGIEVDSSAGGGGTNVGTNIGAKVAVGGTAATKYAGIFTGGNTGFGLTAPAAMVDIVSSGAQLKLSTGSSGVTFTTSGSTLTLAGTLTATSYTGPVAASANITTTGNIGANTASPTTGSALDVKGAIALSQEIDPSTISNVADTGFLFANTDGALLFKNQAGSVTNLSAAASGASTTAQNAFTAQQFFDDQALTSAATVSWNANTAQVATLALGHNATVANATNHQSGGVYIMRVTQASAPKTLAWSTGYKWPGNTAPVMTATGGAVDIFTFVSDGTYMYGSFSGSQNFT
tara:strand:+ start:3055 stop:4707 length:1653 start_codon:yes stop_codon:yes gene_type:complete